MQKPTYTQSLVKLAKKKGMIRPKDLDAIDLPRVYLSRLTSTGHLEKVGRSLYRLPNQQLSEHENLAVVAAKVPQAVFCLLTALQFHELTTQLPRQLWIAMPKGSHTPKMDYPPLKMIQASGESYSEGIEIHKCDQVPIKIYGVAKTLADCFKHRNKIGIDIVLEALKDAREQNKLNTDELWHYAKICRVTNVMRPYLEAIV